MHVHAQALQYIYSTALNTTVYAQAQHQGKLIYYKIMLKLNYA